MTGAPIHWRCGRPTDAHADWCSDGTANDCDHCGGNPCRWWCLGPDRMFSGLNSGGASLRWRPGRVLEPA